MEDQKGQLREQIWWTLGSTGISPNPHGRIPSFEGQNRAAQRLRGLKPYRECACLMAAPDEALLQVRVNALRDSKPLIVATAGLRRGFVILDPRDLRPSSWKEACRANGLLRYGRQMELRPETALSVDLMVTGAVAVDARGRRLGKGSGFFDLEWCVLRHWGVAGPHTPIACVVHEAQIVPEVPAGTWDVAVDWIVTPQRVIRVEGRPPRPSGIPWERIGSKDIRRMKPLWALRNLFPPG